MLYSEFDKYRPHPCPTNSLVNGYEDEAGNVFYVEPGFYYGLIGYKEKKAEDFPRLMVAIEQIVKKEHHVVFTGNYEAPFLEMAGYVYREIGDIADPLKIFVEDKSRGSDYGD